jgi:hypothetical protein
LLVPALRRKPRQALARGALVLACFLLGALPQMLAWKAIFGSYLLADPPHGRDFLRLDHPYLLHTLFSSRHGLLFWTPMLWAGFLGYVLLFRRDRRIALALAVPLALMTWVNAWSGDWWAGGSFSNRRFDSALPLLALGVALVLRALAAAARRPGWSGGGQPAPSPASCSQQCEPHPRTTRWRLRARSRTTRTSCRPGGLSPPGRQLALP